MFLLTDCLFTFYVMFELSLIPTFYIVLIGGSQPERMRAVFYFVFYTVFASLPLLVIVCILKGVYCS